MAQKTPLYENHLAHGGKVVEFAGFLLPVQYEAGVIAEHNAVRNAVGVFDVSHMGEIELFGRGAEASVQWLVSNNIASMLDGEMRYGLLLNEDGGEVDDLMVYKHDQNRFTLVVNASNIEKDFKHIVANLLPETNFINKSDYTGQIAVQGPLAKSVMKKLMDDNDIPTARLTFKENVLVAGINATISRSGYTGEDGFEIYTDAKDIAALYEKTLDAGKEFGILPCGLGCRDTLRFESAMTLYGHELNEDFLATEVGVNWAIKFDKDFIGKKALLNTPPKYKRKGVKLVDKGIARECSDVYDGQRKIGVVTTGTYSPTLAQAIAMVRIEKDFDGDEVEIEVRGKRLRAQFTKLPFYKSEDLAKVEAATKNK